ncbi:MAG: Gfo/Idh/MocA family oxidoreductase, partial [Bryobacteraceae bacterium]
MHLSVLFLLLGLPAFAQPAPDAPKMAIIGLLHSHVWSQLGQISKRPVHLVGVAEPNKDLAAEAKKAGIAEALVFDDYLSMLDRTKPDFVWAFVENNRHLEIVKACAARKIHVIFEKPLASTFKDAVAIRDISRKSGIFVMTNYQMAWWPSQYAARDAVEKGELGKVYRVRGVVGHGGPGSDGVRNKIFFDWLTDPEKNGGGALMDFGCSNALWSLWYLG